VEKGGACLDEDTFAAYFALKLSPPDTQALFAHVDTCAKCARLFSETAALNATASSTIDSAAERTAPTSGTLAPKELPKLGKYRIERMLGMGGMGVVYAGHDPELDRKVAIKLLQPRSSVSSATLRARLMREAQAMAKLSHPNVVHVFEIGTWGEQVFVVMEFVDGATLAGWLKEKPRSWREVLHAFLAAGEGLEAAHQAGIVHRDFKPDNVLVGAGKIRVTDFGLAGKKEDLAEGENGSPPADPGLTYSGLVIGTPAYMAPEQMRGEPTDARSDVFSFSVALYQALFGVRPFAGKSLDELRASIEAGRIEPPPRGDVPSWVERALRPGLAAKPDERYRSMAELLSALRADPTARRRGIAIAILAAALCGVAVFTGARQLRRQSLVCKGGERKLAGIWDSDRRQALRTAALKSGSLPAAWDAVDRSLDAYVKDWVGQHQAACEATRLRGEQSERVLDERMQCLGDRLLSVGALGDVLLRADAKAFAKALDASLALPSLSGCANLAAVHARVLPSDPALHAAVEEQKRKLAEADALSRLGRFDQALPIATAVAEAPATRTFLPLRADALVAEASSLHHLARLDEAVAALHRAAHAAVESRADEAAALAWLDLGLIAGDDLEHLDEGLRWIDLAQAMIQRIGAPPELEIKRLLSEVAIYDTSHKSAELGRVVRQALGLAESLHPPNPLTQSKVLDALAAVLASEAKVDESLATEDRAIKILEENGAGEGETAGAFTFNGAITAFNGHEWANAEKRTRRALEIWQRLLAPDHPNILGGLIFLGSALLLEKRIDEAEKVFLRAQPIAVLRRRELPRGVSQIEWRLGEIDLERKQAGQAVRKIEAALADPGVDSDDRPYMKFSLARALYAAGQKARSIALAAEVKKALAKDPTNLADVEAWEKRR
jgi:tetratricopeptide (TPR) repeat protein